MKKLILTLMIGIISTLNAYAGVRLQAGTFEGTHFNGKSKRDVYMMVIPADDQGRRGSFLSVLFDDDFKQVALYLIDKLDASKYAMIPLEVTPDGEIGINDDNPSLDLIVSSGGDSFFKITSSQSGNNRGFNGHIIIDDTSSKYYWQPLISGDYEYKDNCDALTISAFDTYENEANAVFTTNQLNGSFNIREKFPRMFTLNATKTLATGTETSQRPRKIGIFVNRHRSIFADTMHFLLINPYNDKDVMDFTN